MISVRKLTPYLLLLGMVFALLSPASVAAEEIPDVNPPLISNVVPSDGSTLTESTTLLSAAIGDPESGYDLESIVFILDGQVLGENGIPVNYMHGQAFTYSPELQNGSHAFEIRATDRSGNEARYSGVFYVKKSIWPAGSALEAGNNQLYSVTLSWTSADGSTGYRVYSGQRLLAELDATTLTYEAKELQAGSFYGFKVEARLPDGGWSTDGPSTFTETLPLPHFPPTVWDVHPETGATVTTANPVITAKIRDAGFGLRKDAFQVKVDDKPVPFEYDEATWNLTAEPSALTNGIHALKIRAVDVEGIYKDYNGTFLVEAAWPAGSSLRAENAGQTSLSLDWTPATGSGGYRIFQNGEPIGEVSRTVLSYEAMDLQPGTSYMFKIESKRNDGVWTTDGPSATATTGNSTHPFLARIAKLHDILVSENPTGVRDVRNLRDEIAGLNDKKDLSLIDPVWNKIGAKLPQDSDRAALKSNLFRIIRAIGSIHYDSFDGELNDIRSNPSYRETFRTIAAAGGQDNLAIEDFMTFVSGDGRGLPGLEGTITAMLAQKSKLELLLLVLDKRKQTALLQDALELVLGETEAYKTSALLNRLGVTPQDLLATARNFGQKLKKDKPAIRALAIAYIRSEASWMGR